MMSLRDGVKVNPASGAFARLALSATLAMTLLLPVAFCAPSQAATTMDTVRATFLGRLNTSVTDDYSALGYKSGDLTNLASFDHQSNAHMSAVLGETEYTTTGFSNTNFIQSPDTPDPNYCAGCNGSFRLTFTSTSVGTGNGVFGAGFDSEYTSTSYVAYVTFGDGSTTEVSLNGLAFFGITSDKLIRSIHVGLAGGLSTQSGAAVIDNLTVGGACGDGALGNGENCDDGNLLGGDCCSSNCLVPATAGTSCGDGSTTDCTDPDTCDGAGYCLANDLPAGFAAPAQCDDANDCTSDECDGFGGCQNPGEPAATPCPDATVCNGNETCNGAGTCNPGPALDCDDDDLCTQDSCSPVSGCVNGETPVDACVTGAKGLVDVKNRPDKPTKNQLKWKLSSGGALEQADLGDPVSTGRYALCVYDENAGASSLVASLEVDPSALWESQDPKGFDYRDKTGAAGGVTRVLLKTGPAGKSSASVSARGLNLTMPAPLGETQYFHQSPKLVVQLVNDQNSTCWSSEFGTSAKNDGSRFKAKLP